MGLVPDCVTSDEPREYAAFTLDILELKVTIFGIGSPKDEVQDLIFKS